MIQTALKKRQKCMEEGEDVTFDAAVKQIAATSSVTSDAMLVSQGVFLIYHMHACFLQFVST